MKKIIIITGLALLTISCLYEKGGVIPTNEVTSSDPNNNLDTTGLIGGLCGLSLTANQTSSSGEICFDTQILPLIVSNCAQSGCHDSQSKKDGYDLTSYDKIVSKGISKGNASNSKLYKVLTENGEDRMPPPPKSALTNVQIKLMADWINQGAKNVICTTNGSGTLADTTLISYQTHLKPILDTYCVGCHSASSASGNVKLDNFSNLKIVADNGKLYGSIAQLSGFAAMPTSGKLSDCQIKAFKLWIDQGKLNN